MPKVSVTVEVPEPTFAKIRAIAADENITVDGLLRWYFRSDIAARVKQAFAERDAEPVA